MIVIEQLKNKINKNIVPSGLMVDLNQPFLAASPDGLIGSDSFVEIKCPASAKDITPEEGINNKKIKSCKIINNKLHLKRTDNYYYQVQDQLHIARRMYFIFVFGHRKVFKIFINLFI